MKTAIIIRMRDGHQVGDEYPMDQGKQLIQRWKNGEFKDFLHITLPAGYEWCIRGEDIISIQTGFIQEQPLAGQPAQQGMQMVPRRPLPGSSGLN